MGETALIDLPHKIGRSAFTFLRTAQSPVCCHGGAGAKWPPRQVSEMPIICEAVERAAVANGRKNFVDRGPRRYESSPGELLPQTLPSEPSTAVVEQHADPLPDLPPTVPRAQSLHMLTVAGSARLQLARP